MEIRRKRGSSENGKAQLVVALTIASIWETIHGESLKSLQLSTSFSLTPSDWPLGRTLSSPGGLCLSRAS